MKTVQSLAENIQSFEQILRKSAQNRRFCQNSSRKAEKQQKPQTQISSLESKNNRLESRNRPAGPDPLDCSRLLRHVETETPHLQVQERLNGSEKRMTTDKTPTAYQDYCTVTFVTQIYVNHHLRTITW